MRNLTTFRKALVAAGGSGLFAFAAALGAGLADGALTGAETLVAAGAVLVSAAAVGKATFEVRNANDDPPA